MTSKSYLKYERGIQLNSEESLSKIVSKIQSNSTVLDVGCSSGFLGKYLIENMKCVVDGVDVDSEAIEVCRNIYRKAEVINIENNYISDVLHQKYDFIVVADVLEHLYDPEKFLSDIPRLVNKNGSIIFSVPNVTHIALGLDLLRGNFNYSENGLLDKTHLRFFSRSSLLKLLNKYNLFSWEIDSVNKEIFETEFSESNQDVLSYDIVEQLIKNHKDALTYQWIVTAKTKKPLSPIINLPPQKRGIEKNLLAIQSLTEKLKQTEQAQINAEQWVEKRNSEIYALTEKLKQTEQAQINAEQLLELNLLQLNKLRSELEEIKKSLIFRIFNFFT